jgi:outer membrane protein assembly factor BamD (BamD/ComL family)
VQVQIETAQQWQRACSANDWYPFSERNFDWEEGTMSVGAILGSVLQGALAATNAPSKFKQFQQEFQQLGKDLQAGNLAQAQSDLVILTHNSPFLQSGTASSAAASTGGGSSTSASNNPIVQAFNQLAQDLQAGNLTAAQRDFSTIQQDFLNVQSQIQGSGGGHHHHHALGSISASPLAQLFSQLGQALGAGNLSSAEQAYAALQQDFQQFASGGGSGAGSVNTRA